MPRSDGGGPATVRPRLPAGGPQRRAGIARGNVRALKSKPQ